MDFSKYGLDISDKAVVRYYICIWKRTVSGRGGNIPVIPERKSEIRKIVCGFEHIGIYKCYM